MIVDRAASKRTRQNSPASLALLLPDLRELVQAPESEPPKGNLVERAAVEVWHHTLSCPACLSPAKVASGLPGLSISHSGPSPLALPPPSL